MTSYHIEVNCSICGRQVTGPEMTRPTPKGELRAYRMRWVAGHRRGLDGCEGKVTVAEIATESATLGS